MKRVVSYISVLTLFFASQVKAQEACVETIEKGADYTVKTGTQGFALQASEGIVLKSGAWMQNGSEFVAQITDCDTQQANTIDDTDDGLSNTTQSASGNGIFDTKGELNVSGGNANYTLPIVLPPSIGELGPQINLGYTSGQIHGVAGMGWSINGMSKIHRISTRIDLDGYQSGVTFTNEDKLAIDGQRLIIKTGNYWEDGSTYQTEIQSNTKIELKKSNNQEYFIVTTPEGMRFWYGRNFWEGQDGYSVTGYHIVRQEDTNGNYILYDYTKDKNSLYISTIKFSANKFKGDAPLNKMVFNYTKANRVERSYANGIAVLKDLKLASIEVFTSDEIFRKYELDYHKDDQSGYETLVKVTEKNGKGEEANPVEFEYETTTQKNIAETSLSFNSVLSFNAISNSGDFDGDGNLDFISNYDQLFVKTFNSGSLSPIPVPAGTKKVVNTLHKATNKLNQFQSLAVISQVDNYKSQINVYNLEGKEMVLNYTKYFDLDISPNQLQLEVNSGWTPIVECASKLYGKTRPKADPVYLEGDYNGDGITEMIISIDETKTIEGTVVAADCPDYYDDSQCYTNTQGERYQCGYTTDTVLQKENYILDLNPNLDSDHNASKGFVKIKGNHSFLTDYSVHRFQGDFNGDGKTDILAISSDKSYTIFDITTYEGYAEFNIIGKGTLPDFNAAMTLLLGDFNGDAKTDLTIHENIDHGRWAIYMSNPKPNKGEMFSRSVHHITKEKEPLTYMHFINKNESEERIRKTREELTREYHSFSRYYLIDANSDGKSDLVTIRTNQYQPNTFWDPKNVNSTWAIIGYQNDIGDTSKENSFNEVYHVSHDDGWRNPPIQIVSNYNYQGSRKEVLMYRPEQNILYYNDFQKDITKDALLKKITSSAGYIVNEIEYQPLEPYNKYNIQGEWSDLFYGSRNELEYPNVEMNKLSSLNAVSQIKKTTSGQTLYQNYRYHGLVINMQGQGIIGFKKTARTEWYDSSVFRKKWYVTETDPLLRGAIVRSYTALLIGNGFSFVPLSRELTKSMSVINYNKNKYSATTTDRVYSLLLDEQESYNLQTEVRKTSKTEYDDVYNLPTRIESNIYQGSNLEKVSITNKEYIHNPTGSHENYFIGRLVKETEHKEAFDDIYDSEITYEYASNNLIKVKTIPNKGTQYSQKDYLYDPIGNVVRETTTVVGGSTTVKPNTVSYTYDKTQRFIKTTTNTLGEVITNDTYHPIYGFVTQTTGNNPKLINKTIYDNWGNPIEKIDYLGNSNVYSYERNQDKITVRQIGDDGSSSYKITNVLGQIIEEGTADINGQINKVAYEYDILGRKVKTSEPYRTSPSLWNQVIYDDYERVIRQELSTGKTITHSYKGLTVTTNDGIKEATVVTNASGQKVKVTDPGGTITYAYDANGKLIRSTYGGVSQTIKYDHWGRKTELIDPSAGKYTYEYDAYGNIVKETTPLGATNYTYDENGSLIKKQLGGSNNGYTTTYTYDPDTNLLKNTIHVSQAGQTTHNYYYDEYYRLKSTSEYTPVASYITHLQYGGLGRVVKETNKVENRLTGQSQEIKIQNQYKNGYLWKKINDVTSEVLWSVDNFNERGQLEKATYGNGLKLINAYDDYGNFTQIAHKEDEHSSNYIAGYTYQFDQKRGNLNRRETHGRHQLVEVFEYDELDRLEVIDYTNGTKDTFEYDPQGRMRYSDKLGTYNYDNTDKPFQLTSIEMEPAGQLDQSNYSPQHVSFTAFKRPHRIHQQGKETFFFDYNLDEQRSVMYYGDLNETKSQKKLQKHYSTDGKHEFIYNRQTGETTFITYVGGDAYSSSVVIKGNGTTQETLYLHRDYQGSIVAITNQQAQVVESRMFDAWGQLKEIKNQLNTIVTTLEVLDRGYTGHEHLQTVGLINMNGRLYDAKVHRFLSPDNYVQEPNNTQNYNRYGYVLNNPLKYTDPSGEEFITGTAIIVGAAIAVAGYLVANIVYEQPITLKGVIKSAVIGAISGAITCGIGSATECLSGFAQAGIQAAAHGTFQGIQSGIEGSGFWTGFAAGAISSIASSAFSADFNGAKEGLGFAHGIRSSRAGLIAFGGLSGGVGAELTGGNFFKGMTVGLMVSALNHAMHKSGPGDPDPKPKEVDSTTDAVEHYFSGDGEPVELGPKTKLALKNSPEYQRVVERLKTGIATKKSYNFGVDMTGKVFHVGDTRVDYSTSCTSGECITRFRAFSGDGFRDPLDIGIEVYSGTPYNYVPYNFSISYPNPGYQIGINIK